MAVSGIVTVTSSAGDSATSGSLLNVLSTVTGSADVKFSSALMGSTITLSAGPLSVGSSPGSLTLDTALFTSGATITVNLGSNAITATSLIAAGPGIVALTGNGSNYSGTVSIGSGSELSLGSAIAAAGALTFDFSQSSGGPNSPSAILAGTAAALGGDTIKNFQLGNQLIVIDAIKANTTVSLSGTTLTVTDAADSVTATLTLSGSLTDDGIAGDETISVLTSTASGKASVDIVPAMLVSDSIGDDTGTFSLRHAASVVTTSSAAGASGDVILFSPTLNGKTIAVGGTTALSLPSATVRLEVDAGTNVTIFGSDSGPLVGGIHKTAGFLKVGGGTLTLAGDESALTGVASASGGTFDIETTQLGASLAFRTGFNTTIAGTSATLAGKTISNFLPGDTLKINDINFAGSTSLNATGVVSGAGPLTLTQSLPEGGSTSVTVSLATSSIAGVTEGFVLLRDSIDGSAFIRPSIIAGTDAALVAAVATLTGSTFFNTSFDVIDLGGEYGTSTLALGASPILFNTSSGIFATVSENLSGANDFFKTGIGTLTLTGSESLTGTASIGGGKLILNTSTFASGVSALDMAPGRSTVEATAANLNGLHVTNFHLGDAIHFIGAASTDTIFSSFSNALTSSLNVSISDQATGSTVSGSITIGFAGTTLQTIAEVFDGGGAVPGQLIVPAIASGQTISANASDLGSATAILSGGTLMLTGHGTNTGQFFGAGTLEVSLPSAAQVVKLTNTSAGFGASDTFSGFTGALKIDAGTLDMSADALSITNTINAALTSASAQINVNSALDGHLSFSSIAGGSAIDVSNVSFANVDLVNSGISSISSGGALLTLQDSGHGSLFHATLPGSALAFASSGALQIVSDGSAGTLIAFGNSVVTAPASTFATPTGISGGSRPTTLSITGSAATIDLSSVTLGGTINSLDVSGTGATTVKLNSFEASQLASITGSGSTTITFVTDGATYNATNNFKLTGVSTVDLAGHNETLVINANSPPTGLKIFHGNADGTDTITGTDATMDLRGVLFTGNGVITGSAVDTNNFNAPIPTTYIVSDGNALTHIHNFSGADTINLVDTAQLSATYTPDEIAYALGNNFTLQLNGAAFPLPFTPPGGEQVSILATTNPVFSGGGGIFTLSGSLAVSGGVTHFALPSGTTFNLANLTITGGTAADPVVFFGAPGSTVTLPNAVPGGGQTAVEYEINGGNNAITAGSAPTEIWGGPGSDSIILTTGAGTISGGTGTATLQGGSSSAATYGGTGAVILFGASGGGIISNGGDHSELISGGGITTLNANSAVGVIHQAFFGSQDTTAGALDTFNLSSVAGSQDVVTAGSANAVVNGHLGNDTVIAGSGTISILPGTNSENLTFVAKSSSGGTERATISGGSEATLVAYGGDGADSIAASLGGNSTIVGGSGTDTFFGAMGNGYMLSQGTKDMFQFSGNASPTNLGTFYVEGFTAGTDVLQVTGESMTGSAFLATGTMVTIAAGGVVSATDSLTSHLIGLTALQFTLVSGEKIDVVGVTTIALTDMLIS